ncbi:uncharacterized protein MKK02DRAFT_16374 [Dioszegia hungarica]|uniref:NAD-dependent epimerase/dehydratase domain-containing protein n=1 Tax=Dioszegia hungarica TaxID=4972 RepID=A0AA38H5P0_9TREE|nr:uncharacterized protein MKK02DRAFT_16374 [Dioszegia hungarica]KAI9634600.1 hypothetical protein MKK02DRAFT_16374 [Dioszegia hungarica]
MTSPAPDHPYTIAVTGASGLLASGFIRLALEQGHRIVALDRMPTAPAPSSFPAYTYTQVDLLDYDAFLSVVKEGGCDAIVHLAAACRKHDGFGNYLDGGLKEREVYTMNTAMSYNALSIAAELGIQRVVMASSVNSIGMLFSKTPQFDYLPLDEQHAHYPEDAYSLAKHASELQASALTRRNPHLPLRIASLRFHWVVPTPLATPSSIASHLGSPKDLFGWVSVSSASEAVLLALTAPLTTFPAGHEAFFIVARTLCGGRTREEAIAELAGGVEWRGGEEGMRGNGGLFDTRKAERMLGWVDEGYPIE